MLLLTVLASSGRSMALMVLMSSCSRTFARSAGDGLSLGGDATTGATLGMASGYRDGIMARSLHVNHDSSIP